MNVEVNEGKGGGQDRDLHQCFHTANTTGYSMNQLLSAASGFGESEQNINLIVT